mgnify:CR=1 FL=1|jgi:hypothetical protein
MNCQKCRVAEATIRCPQAPHKRCDRCWTMWFNEGYIPGRRRHPGRWSDKTRVKRQKRLLKAFRRRVDRWVREVGARRDYQPMKLCGRELPGDAMCMDERFHPWACTPAVRWDASKQTWVSVMS